MGEAAVKEPSMEDILSSIRKIISEEGNAPVAEEQISVAPEVSVDDAVAVEISNSIDQVRAVEPEPVESVSYNETSGNDAAKMAASLASIAENVRAEMPAEPEVALEPSTPEVEASTQSVWDEISEPSQEEVQFEETTPSLASIAETVVEQVEAPVSHVTEQTSEPEIHVEMAQATPAPEPEVAEEVAAPISSAAVESMVEEEMAFKGALMSPSANGAVSGAFDRLKRSAMDDVDAKTEAILRPMLREWLDENLPKMVERLVREEIERVARGV